MLKFLNKAPILRSVAMPKHLGPSGIIFGGWLISKMDLAGGISAWDTSNGKIYTASCHDIKFYKPVKVADIIGCYTEILEINNSSIKIKVDTEIYRMTNNTRFKALDGIFTYVAIDDNGKPRNIKETETLEKTLEDTSNYSHS